MIGLTNKIADSKVGFRVFVSLVLLFLVGSPLFFGLRFSWYAAGQWALVELIICGTALAAGVIGVGVPALIACLIATVKHREVTQKDREIGVAVLMVLLALAMMGLLAYVLMVGP